MQDQLQRKPRPRHPSTGKAQATKTEKVLQQMQMKEIRCGHCRRKLAEGAFFCLSIKCPRCGTLNYLSAESIKSEPERHGTPIANNRSHYARSNDTKAAPR
ncbi:TPA: Com family DNA-binding transcriptional regulator [Citrobacter farmeri]